MQEYEALRYILVMLGAGIEAVAADSQHAVTAWTRAGEALKILGIDPEMVDQEVVEEIRDLLGD